MDIFLWLINIYFEFVETLQKKNVKFIGLSGQLIVILMTKLWIVGEKFRCARKQEFQVISNDKISLYLFNSKNKWGVGKTAVLLEGCKATQQQEPFENESSEHSVFQIRHIFLRHVQNFFLGYL